jgi:hypothetical protein
VFVRKPLARCQAVLSQLDYGVATGSLLIFSSRFVQRGRMGVIVPAKRVDQRGLAPTVRRRAVLPLFSLATVATRMRDYQHRDSLGDRTIILEARRA